MVGLVLFSVAKAADAVWNGPTGTQAWATDGNWSPATAPGATTGTANQDSATFSTAGAGTLITIDAGRNIKNLNFSTPGGVYTIGSEGANGGAALHLSSGGTIKVNNDVTSTTTVNAPLILEAATSGTAGTYTFSNSANSTTAAATTPKLNFNGGISGGTTSSTVTLTLAGTVGGRSGANATDALNQANTISGIISDGGAQGGLSLTIGGTAGSVLNAWNLTALNTFSGSVSNSGVLYFNSIGNKGEASALGTGSTVGATITVGGHFLYIGGTTSTDRAFTGSGGSFYNNGGGILTLNGAITGSGIAFRGNNTIVVNGLISGAGFGLTKTNGNTLILTNNANSFGSATLSLAAGIISATSIADKSVNSAIGAGTAIAFGQNQTGDNIGRLQLTSPTGGSSNRDMVINGGASNTLAGPAGAFLENTVAGQMMTMTAAIRTASSGTSASYTSLELGGAGNGTMNGTIGGMTNAITTPTNLALIKSGAGIWTTNGSNIFYGKTTVNGGSLLLGSAAKLDGTSGVVVAANATLGGAGTIRTDNTSAPVLAVAGANPAGTVTGTIAVAANGILAPGLANATGTLTIDSGTSSATNVLTLAANAKFRFKLDAGLQSDMISLINGSASDILFGGNTIDFTDLTGGQLAAGTYTLFTANVANAYAGLTVSGGTITSGLSIGSGLASYSGSTLGLSGNDIVLTIAVPEPGQAALLLSGLIPIFFRRRRRS